MGVSKSPLFATETQRIYSKLFFFFRKNLFFIELVPGFFSMAGENSKRVVEVVPCIFFIGGRKFQACLGGRVGGEIRSGVTL